MRKSERPCRVCGMTPSEDAHLASRARGGHDGPTIPLCVRHHRGFDVGTRGVRFDILPYLDPQGKPFTEAGGTVEQLGLISAYRRLTGRREIEGDYLG